LTAFPILSSIIILPLFGAFIASLVKGNEKEVTKNVRDLALWVSIVELILVFLLLYQFNASSDTFQFVEKKIIFSKFGISYFLGVDAVSVTFILLTAILFPICIFYSKLSIKLRTKEFMVSFLILEALVIGVFSCLDIILFYIFFESLLIPMFLIIGIWGGKKRIFASYKFFLYTLAGSVFFLLAIIVMASIANTTSIVELDNYYFESGLQNILWLGMFISFAIKVPMWPFHTWLPDAHVEAPTVGSIILAGILLKVGGYAFLRLSLPILPDASIYFANYVIVLSIIAIIYTSFVALAQKDMKKMIAYSSVAHMGYVTAAIFSFTEEGIKGAIFQMVSHGIVSSALFLSIGVLYEQTKSREINNYSFLVKSMPLFSLFFIVIVLSSIGLPGTSGFIGELMSVLGVYKYNALFGFLVAFGLILGAIYMLKLVKVIIFVSGDNKVSNLKDLVLTENILLLIFVISTILLGLFPNLLLQFIDVSVIKILTNYKGL
jgi:NADH-quinone oxidoreductase subunit M